MNTIPLFEFNGGIHPAENKIQSTQEKIQPFFIPEKLILPVNQHIGAPAKPIVEIGQKVLKGQLIAQAQDFVSCNLHAPTSGIVSAIELRDIPHQSGIQGLCIELTTDGKDEWIKCKGLGNYLQADAKQLLECIQQAGISGLGGAGFPSHVKYAIPASKIDTLIINAAECEPYITADDSLMREYAQDIIAGIMILESIIEPQQTLIGIEDNKPMAIAALNTALKSTSASNNIQVICIPTKYPSGGEKQLIQILTGKEVPSSGLPADIGIICQNVATAYAIFQAVVKGEPLISRITTITGNAITSPHNRHVLFGTPVDDLLENCGYKKDRINRLIMGGPMMGFSLPNSSVPIIKSSNCIIAATKKELPRTEQEQACIRCGMCTQACPAQLLPQQLYWFAKSSNIEQAQAHNIGDCIECGACSYVCPSNIPLVQYYRFAKGEIKQAQADKLKSDKAKDRFDTRTARLEREQAQKDAKRKARAEAAAKKQAEKKAALESQPAEDSNTETVQVTVEDLEKLKQKVLAAQTRIDKAQERLNMAKEQNLDTADALQLGLNKQTAKLLDAQKALADARQQPQTKTTLNKKQEEAK